MKRRAFLTALGALASCGVPPIAGFALPRPANPAALAKGGPVTPTKYIVGENPCELIVQQNKEIAGIVRSVNNKLVINLSEGRITFRD